MNVIDMMYGRKSIHHDLWWYFTASSAGSTLADTSVSGNLIDENSDAVLDENGDNILV